MSTRPNVKINQFKVTGGRLLWIDRTQMQINNIELEVNNINLAQPELFTYDFKGTLGNTPGRIALSGEAMSVKSPLNFKIKAGLTDAPIRYFEAYYADRVDTRITGGMISAESQGQCQDDQFYLNQRIIVKNLQFAQTESSEGLFGLNPNDVLGYVADNQGQLEVSFEINENLKNPNLRWNNVILGALKDAVKKKVGKGVQKAVTQKIGRELFGRMLSAPGSASSGAEGAGAQESSGDVKDVARELLSKLF